MHVHVVMVRLSDAATADRCTDAMCSMEGRIEGMVGLECRRNEIEGPHSADVMLLTRWRDLDAYRAYQVDPVHIEVAELVRSLMADASTMDWTE